MMRHVVYGGQFGSEGKGNVSEFLFRSYPSAKKLIAIGENSPNSGHTCTRGKTRNIPAASFFAEKTFLGPDSVIDLEVLRKDIDAVKVFNPNFEVYIHENAAVLLRGDNMEEASVELEKRIGSTVTGSGFARHRKMLNRNKDYVVGSLSDELDLPFKIVTREQWMEFVDEVNNNDEVLFIFECSQGLMLDVNLGYYPYVTSRTTVPQAALIRNGFDPFLWKYCAVYRTYPIRTGGNTGPTGGEEITWESLKLAPEVATVTGRNRRIFKWSQDDFVYSLQLCLPEMVFITHADYIIDDRDLEVFLRQVKNTILEFVGDDQSEDFMILASRKPSEFGIVELE